MNCNFREFRIHALLAGRFPLRQESKRFMRPRYPAAVAVYPSVLVRQLRHFRPIMPWNRGLRPQGSFVRRLRNEGWKCASVRGMGKLVCPCSPAEFTGKLPLDHAMREFRTFFSGWRTKRLETTHGFRAVWRGTAGVERAVPILTRHFEGSYHESGIQNA
jgi:hypothetical protein